MSHPNAHPLPGSSPRSEAETEGESRGEGNPIPPSTLNSQPSTPAPPTPAPSALNPQPSTLHFATALLLTLLTILLPGCATEIIHPQPKLTQQTGESVVFIGVGAASLAFIPQRTPPLRVRGSYEPGAIEYVEGEDYIVDYSAGTLRRTIDSRIPDFRNNMLYGKEDFSHGDFPGFGNGKFFVFMDYVMARPVNWPIQSSQVQLLTRTRKLLQGGYPVKIVAFGDSITAGGEATRPGLIFWQHWADDLQRKYPKAKITIVNGATGGDNTVMGLERLKAKVIAEKPDLVLVGFGMNDHNKNGVPIPQYEQNLDRMVVDIRRESAADIIMFSTFPPNPKWRFGSSHMQDYAAATETVARRSKCAFVDIYNNWQTIAARKKPEDLLGNNINHPNDYGHWIYYRAFCEMGL